MLEMTEYLSRNNRPILPLSPASMTLPSRLDPHPLTLITMSPSLPPNRNGALSKTRFELVR
jgi:hypothetical protein